ncbi:MAG UNVERIFIED_CONTAM: hypothetical protein LVQ98_07620 [Rickettsiaceae bacterium]
MEQNTTIQDIMFKKGYDNIEEIVNAHLRANQLLAKGEFAEAIAVFQEIKNGATADDKKIQKAAAGEKKCWQAWGEQLRKDDKEQQALEKFDAASKIDPNDLTTLKAHLPDTQAAKADDDIPAPITTPASLWQAWVQQLQKDDKEQEALEKFDAASKIDPNDLTTLKAHLPDTQAAKAADYIPAPITTPASSDQNPTPEIA